MVSSQKINALVKTNPIAMIKLYSGTPGSGKSFHLAKDIITYLRFKRNVISTVDVDINKISRNGRLKLGDFVYVPILELEPDFLYQYAFKHHKKGKEGQTWIIIDECQILFNPREYHLKNRQEWILFFTKHRHLGYHIIMISQFDRLIDRQIRCLFEYEVKHRKVNNLLFLLPFTAFAAIEYWYGAKVLIGKRFFLFNRQVASIYDSYTMFDEFEARYRAKHPDPVPHQDTLHESGTPEPTLETADESEPQPLGAEMGDRGSPSERLTAEARKPSLLSKVSDWFSNPMRQSKLKHYNKNNKKPD